MSILIQKILNQKFGKDCGEIIYNLKLHFESLEPKENTLNTLYNCIIDNRKFETRYNISLKEFKNYLILIERVIILRKFIIKVEYYEINKKEIKYFIETYNYLTFMFTKFFLNYKIKSFDIKKNTLIISTYKHNFT